MKLRRKVFAALTIVWVPFLVVAYVSVEKSSFIPVMLASLALYGFTLWLIQSSLLKRIKKVNRELEQIQTKQTLSQRIQLQGEDELAQIVSQINILLDTIRLTPKKYLENQTEALAHKTPLDQMGKTKEETNIHFDFVVPTEIQSNKISRFAHYDKFIALPNRVLFNELLNKAISHAKRHNKILAILIISIEPINSIAPTLGSNLDENAVKEIGNRLAFSLRNEDVIAKLDGNEFIVLLNDIGKSKFASS